MDAIKCDRCGELEAHVKGQSTVEVMTCITVDKEGGRALVSKNADLCSPCTSKLKSWLAKKPT